MSNVVTSVNGKKGDVTIKGQDLYLHDIILQVNGRGFVNFTLITGDAIKYDDSWLTTICGMVYNITNRNKTGSSPRQMPATGVFRIPVLSGEGWVDKTFLVMGVMVTSPNQIYLEVNLANLDYDGSSGTFNYVWSSAPVKDTKVDDVVSKLPSLS